MFLSDKTIVDVKYTCISVSAQVLTKTIDWGWWCRIIRASNQIWKRVFHYINWCTSNFVRSKNRKISKRQTCCKGWNYWIRTLVGKVRIIQAPFCVHFFLDLVFLLNISNDLCAILMLQGFSKYWDGWTNLHGQQRASCWLLKFFRQGFDLILNTLRL